MKLTVDIQKLLVTSNTWWHRCCNTILIVIIDTIFLTPQISMTIFFIARLLTTWASVTRSLYWHYSNDSEDHFLLVIMCLLWCLSEGEEWHAVTSKTSAIAYSMPSNGRTSPWILLKDFFHPTTRIRFSLWLIDLVNQRIMALAHLFFIFFGCNNEPI